MSKRWISRSASVAMATLRGSERQCQRKGRSLAAPGAGRVQRAADLPGGGGAAVQAETRAVRTGGEAVIEDALEVLRRNADAGVDDVHDDGRARRADAHGDAFLATFHLVTGV